MTTLQYFPCKVEDNISSDKDPFFVQVSLEQATADKMNCFVLGWERLDI